MANDYDDFNLDLPNFEDWESDDSRLKVPTSKINAKDRNPIKAAGRFVTSALKPGIGQTLNTLNSDLNRKFRNTKSTVDDVFSTMSEIERMRTDLMKDMGPISNQTKRVAEKLVRQAKPYLPNSIHDKLQKRFKVAQEEERKSAKANTEQAEQATVDSAIERIFSEQQLIEEERRKENNKIDQVEKQIDRSLDASRHKDTLLLLDNIRKPMQHIGGFYKHIYPAYLKETLKLQYKSVFIGQKQLETQQLTAKLLDQKLDAIIKNTELPDIQKQTRRESFEVYLREKMSERVGGTLKNWGQKIVQNVKDKVFDPMRTGMDTYQMMMDGVEQGLDMNEMYTQMGGQRKGISQLAGMGAGKALGYLGGKQLTKKMGGFNPYARNVENISKTAKMRAMLKSRDEVDKQHGGTKGFFFDLLNPGLRSNAGKMQNKLAKDPNALTSFDVATRASIVEIIPAYLARIEQNTRAISTGQPAEELAFDINKRNLTTVSKFKESTLNNVFGNKEERAYRLSEGVSTIRASLAHHNEKDELANFDKLNEEVTKVLGNMAINVQDVKPEEIKEIAETGKIKSKYQKIIFEGVKHPRQVARILTASLYSKGRINNGAVSRLNDYVYTEMGRDEYLDKITALQDTFGQGRYFDDMFEGDPDESGTRKFKSSSIRKHKYGNVDKKVLSDMTNMSTKWIKQQMDDESKEYKNIKGPKFIQKLAEALIGSDMDPNLINDSSISDFVLGDNKNTKTTSGFIKRTALGNIGRSLHNKLPSNNISQVEIIGQPVHVIIDQFDTKFKSPKSTQTSLGISDSQPVVGAINQFENTFKEYIAQQKSVSTKLLEHTAHLPSLEHLKFSLADISSGITNLNVLQGIPEQAKAKAMSLWSKGKESSKRLFSGAKDLVKFSWDKQLQLLSTGKDLALGGAGLGLNVLKMFGPSAIGLLGKGVGGIWNTQMNFMKGLGKGAGKAIGSVFNILSGKTNTEEKYFDIFLKDQIDIDNPLLSKRKQEEGVVYSNGKPVASTNDIDQPIFDSITGDTLITKSDIRHGLVNRYNEPLKAAQSASSELLKKMSSGAGKLFSGIKGTASKLLGDAAGMYSGMFNFGLDALRGVGTLGSNLLNKAFGKSSKSDPIVERLDKIYDYMVAKWGKVEKGDTDGDGFREGSWQDKDATRKKTFDRDGLFGLLGDKFGSLKKGAGKTIGAVSKIAGMLNPLNIAKKVGTNILGLGGGFLGGMFGSNTFGGDSVGGSTGRWAGKALDAVTGGRVSKFGQKLAGSRLGKIGKFLFGDKKLHEQGPLEPTGDPATDLGNAASRLSVAAREISESMSNNVGGIGSSLGGGLGGGRLGRMGGRLGRFGRSKFGKIAALGAAGLGLVGMGGASDVVDGAMGMADTAMMGMEAGSKISAAHSVTKGAIDTGAKAVSSENKIVSIVKKFISKLPDKFTKFIKVDRIIKAIMSGGKKIVGKLISKFLGPIGWVVTGASAAYAAWQGYKHASDILGYPEESLSVMDKLKTGAASAICDGLMLEDLGVFTTKELADIFGAGTSAKRKKEQEEKKEQQSMTSKTTVDKSVVDQTKKDAEREAEMYATAEAADEAKGNVVQRLMDRALNSSVLFTGLKWSLYPILHPETSARWVYNWFGTESWNKECQAARAKAYGIDFKHDYSWVTSTKTIMLNLEEKVAEILEDPTASFTTSDIEKMADKFSLCDNEKQVKYWTTWFYQRFMPTFKAFIDLLRNYGCTYKNHDYKFPTDKAGEMIKKFEDFVKSKISELQNLIPTVKGFEEFEKQLAKMNDERKSGKNPITSKSVTENSKIKQDNLDKTQSDNRHTVTPETIEASRRMNATLQEVGAVRTSGPIGNIGGQISAAASAATTTVSGSQKLSGGVPVTPGGSGTGGKIDDIPMPTGDGSWDALGATIVAAAKMAGVDPGLMATMASIESGFRSSVKAGTSSASGLYQFIDSTWVNMLNKYGGKYGLAPNTPKSDARANALMGAEYLKENQKYLESKLGRKATDTDLYLAHFLGAGGAVSLLNGNPNDVAANLNPKAAKANPGIFRGKNGKALTVKEVYEVIDSKVSGHRNKYAAKAKSMLGQLSTGTKTEDPSTSVAASSSGSGLSAPAVSTTTAAGGAATTFSAGGPSTGVPSVSPTTGQPISAGSAGTTSPVAAGDPKDLNLKPGANVQGLNPSMLNNLTSMNSEYKDQFGGKGFQINSAYRSIEDQAKLFQQKGPGWAAPPGRSLHNFGLAVDISAGTGDADKLDSSGLLQKYGFHRPLLNARKPEPWHIEPMGIDKAAIKQKGYEYAQNANLVNDVTKGKTATDGAPGQETEGEDTQGAKKAMGQATVSPSSLSLGTGGLPGSDSQPKFAGSSNAITPPTIPDVPTYTSPTPVGGGISQDQGWTTAMLTKLDTLISAVQGGLKDGSVFEQIRDAIKDIDIPDNYDGYKGPAGASSSPAFSPQTSTTTSGFKAKSSGTPVASMERTSTAN